MSRGRSKADTAPSLPFGYAPDRRRLWEPLCARCARVGSFGFFPPGDLSHQTATFACAEHRAAVEAEWRTRYGIAVR